MPLASMLEAFAVKLFRKPQTTEEAPISLYRPLASGDVRLIRLRPGAWDDPVSVELRHWEASEKPEYYALSYAWGYMTESVTITVNGKQHAIGVGLHEALRRLRLTLVKVAEGDAPTDYNAVFVGESHDNFWLWTDSLCLDQTNDAEKQAEIPKMGQIYGHAKQVIGWLGESSDDEDAGVKLLVDLCSIERPDITKYDAYRDEGYQQRVRDAISTRTEEFLRALHALMERPFFSRLWIIQEMALAKVDPLLLVGQYHCHLYDLNMVWQFALSTGQLAKSPVQFTNTHGNSSIFLNLRHIHGATPVRAAPVSPAEVDVVVAWRLNRDLRLVRGGFISRSPHDQLYGVLGIVASDGHLPPQLRPDYSKPYEQVFGEYARFCLEHCDDLSLINRTRRQLPSGTPTWVPDYRHATFTPLTAAWAGSECPVGRTKSSLEFLDGNRLRVHGVVLEPCFSVFDSALGVKSRIVDEDVVNWKNTQLPRLRAFFEDTSAKTDHTMTELVHRWLDMVYEPTEAYAATARVKRQVADILLNGAAYPGPDGTSNRLVALVPVSSLLATGHGFVDRMIRLDAAPRVGDVVCAIKGSDAPVLLRPVPGGGGADEYEFLGMVQRWEDGKVLWFKPDFWEGKELQDFILI